jgi:hypothetical protein
VLVVESEIQALVALVLCSLDVVFSLCGRPRVPDFISPVVLPFVEKVYRQIKKDVANTYPNEIFVATTITRGVV